VVTPGFVVAIRFSLRSIGFLAVLLAGLVVYLLGMPFGVSATRLGKLVWFKGCLLLLNIRVERHGAPFRACPTLFVANHVSWLDILVLGAAIDGTFVAKSEVAGWPVFGWLARLVDTMFIRRHWRMALIQRNELAARLRSGHDIILFPEGTSTPGHAVERFKSSLFGAAEPQILDRPVAVQAVTLAYVALADGTPIGPDNADRYAWFDDAVFAPHLLRVLGDRGCRIEMVFHDPVLSWEVHSRKALARQAEAVIGTELLARHAKAALGQRQGVAGGLLGPDAVAMVEERAEGAA
jgi:1-acyl-sn-glycerol-3-phosphate acyltransferase